MAFCAWVPLLCAQFSVRSVHLAISVYVQGTLEPDQESRPPAHRCENPWLTQRFARDWILVVFLVFWGLGEDSRQAGRPGGEGRGGEGRGIHDRIDRLS